MLLLAALQVPTRWRALEGLGGQNLSVFQDFFSALVVYLIARLIWERAPKWGPGLITAACALLLELLQLAKVFEGEAGALQSRFSGGAFEGLDLVAYAVAIGMGMMIDRWITASPQSPPSESPRTGSSQP